MHTLIHFQYKVQKMPIIGIKDANEQTRAYRFLGKIWGSYHGAFIHNDIGVCLFINMLTWKAVYNIVSEKSRLKIRLYRVILFS